jgi:D-serine dehydratase
VILAFGKRDVSYDHLPRPLAWHRPGDPAATPQAIPDGHAVVNLSDQHAFLDVPEDSPLQVGDLVGVGISHPCLTFDKWQVLHLVDDAYTVTGSIRTYF